MVDAMNRAGVHMPPAAIRSCRELYERHFDGRRARARCAAAAYCHAHDRDDARVRQASLLANWLDEALNKLLKASYTSVSQATFEPALLARMATLLPAEGSRKRKL